MAAIDGLLKLAQQQGANELRLAVDQSPRMFARGTPKRLSVPATSEPTLRTLLGGILTAALEEQLHAQGSAETSYQAGALGAYRVTFTARGSGFSVVFLEGGSADVAAPGGGGADQPQPAAPEPPRSALAGVARGGGGEAHAGTALEHPEPPAAARVVAQRVPAATQATVYTRADVTADRARANELGPEPTPDSHPATPDPTQPQPPLAASSTALALEAPQLSAWLRRAAALRASDLHLAQGECPCVRVDGELVQLDNQILDDLAAVIPLEPGLDARLARGESLDLALEVAGAGRTRAHLYATDSGPAAALRLLPRAAPSFGSLHMPCSFEDLVDLPHGLVLVCGAAGSGKSTTLAALAQVALSHRSIVLVTLEDPIEYALMSSATSLVRRRQIGRDAPNFARGLRDALRADPDVLLIGELRDSETIALALTAAETGHLVLASMHSRSAASAIERIVDSFPGDQQQQVRIQLAESLRAVVAQRLLRRRHGEGRLPAIELLRVNRAVASLIREGKTAQIATVLQSNRRDGMLALERSLADRIQAGEVQNDDAFAAANDPDALSQFLLR
ncbi:MAG: PilT/PilU family type 4a pilus ATPase [Polyangiales bacterium]